MKDIFNVKGKTAVVTGGLGHLGKAMTKALRDYGAKVIIPYRRKVNPADVFEHPTGIHVKKCDLSVVDDISAFFKEVYDSYGKIDILVNNAAYGGGAGGKTVKNPVFPDDDIWEKGLEGAVTITYRCIKGAVKYLNRGASIINISSMYGSVAPDKKMYDKAGEGLTSPPMYGAGKAGTIQLTKYYASFLTSSNIRVNCIIPGPFPNKSVCEKQPELEQELKNRTLTGRYGKPNELTGALLLLASKASSFMTGSEITVDGGWSVR